MINATQNGVTRVTAQPWHKPRQIRPFPVLSNLATEVQHVWAGRG
jgi:hypothetical protein